MSLPFDEFRRRRDAFTAEAGMIDGILSDGARKARAVASKTMDEVRRAMRLR
jgi:hypothetical protein